MDIQLGILEAGNRGRCLYLALWRLYELAPQDLWLLGGPHHPLGSRGPHWRCSPYHWGGLGPQGGLCHCPNLGGLGLPHYQSWGACGGPGTEVHCLAGRLRSQANY